MSVPLVDAQGVHGARAGRTAPLVAPVTAGSGFGPGHGPQDAGQSETPRARMNGTGSDGTPLRCTSKCRWQPVELPVDPTRATS